MTQEQVGYTGTEKEPIERWDHAQFVQWIKDSSQGRELSQKRFPQRIDVSGVVGAACDRVLAATLSDPEHPEYATFGKASPDGEVLRISNSPQRGEDSTVVTRFLLEKKKGSLPQYSQWESVALMIHSHGIDHEPPSPRDASHLVIEADKGHHASFIITASLRYLLIRSLEVDELGAQATEQFKLDWEAEIRKQAEAKIISVVQEHMQSYAQRMKPYGGVSASAMDQFKREKLEEVSKRKYSEIQYELLLEKMHERKFLLYVATPAEPHVYRRVK